MRSAQHAWEALSNTWRLYAESSLRLKSLVEIDAEEAISNHDRAFDAKMEAFHRLYDVTKSMTGFSYFAHGDTSLLIVLRNALHHHDHRLFKSWNKMLSTGGYGSKAGSEFLLASYAGRSEVVVSKYFLQLQDFHDRLNHPSIKQPSTLRAMWDSELSFAAIADKGRKERYPGAHVYVDLIPICISALQRITSWMQAGGIVPIGFDSETYFNHFSAMDPVSLSSPFFQVIRLP